MAEVGTSVASKLVEYLVDPALSEGQSLFCVGKITRNLETRKEELLLTQGRLQRNVEEALARAEEIDGAVTRWKNNVKEIIAEVENLQQELNANRGYFRGWCPTWKRYRLCKQLAKKTETMLQLNINSKFDPFSRPVPLSNIKFSSSGNFIYFQSTTVAADKLLAALGDDSCYRIGLYGMGGSGKTSLAREVSDKAKEMKIFDRVVFTTVSQTPNVSNIQVEIADLLGLKFQEESEQGRAGRLSLRLRSGERILIVLDDVWGKLDFDKIGIPVETETRGCKVLLTTRLRQVCTLMGCNARIPLSLLSEEESWTLFERHASINDASSSNSMDEVARGVVRECKGLPIGIVAVGSSLKEKSEDEWKVALDNLRHSKPVDVEPGVRDAFTCLKLSYDYLKKEAAKPIFFLCSMFPENHEISIEDLLRYGIGFGVCGQADSFEVARNKVNAAVTNLIESSLLTYSKRRRNCLKMHDMVRDTALWIVTKEKGTVLVNQAKKLNELAEDEALKDYYAISSWDEQINWIPHQFNAPRLEILILNQLSDSVNQLDLSHESFEGVKELKVMAIINSSHFYKKLSVLLPQSTQWLTHLRALRLVGLVLYDISFVVSLRRLEILDLRYSEFNELPNEVEKLKKLKLLDLSRCKINKCCDDVVRRCSELEELYIFGDRIVIKSYECIEENVNFMKLRSYVLRVGQPRDYYTSHDLPTRVLKLEDFDISTSGEVIKDLLKRALEVELKCLKGGSRSIFPEMVETVRGMNNELTKLYLEDCNEIECLINNTPAHGRYFQEDNVFPKLVEVTLINLSNLEEVCRGPPPLGLFQKLEKFSIKRCNNWHSVFPRDCSLYNLKHLEIEECPKLKSLFSMSTARSLEKLEKISLRGCGMLEHVIRNGDCSANTGQEILPVLDNSRFAFPQLKRISIEGCDKLECVFPISCALGLPQVKVITIRDVSCLKYIFGRHEEVGVPDDSRLSFPQHDGEDCSSSPEQIQNLLPLLKELKLVRLPNFLKIFQENNYPSCPSRKKQEWNLQTDVVNGRRLSGDVPLVQLSILGLQHLQHLRVTGCGKLKYVFSMDVLQKGLPVLSSLSISDLEELEEVIVPNEEPQNISNVEPWFPNLKDLRVRRCNKLKRLFSSTEVRMLPQLSSLDILEAEQLEEIFTHKTEDTEEKIVLPNLSQITLQKLPVLVDVCQGMKLHTVQLTDITIVECPKFVPVSEYFQMALEENDGQSVEKQLNVNEDQQISVISTAEQLILMNLSDLMFVWKGPTLSSFKSLRYLWVEGSRKLKSIFSAAVIRSLPQLEELRVRHCEELEEIMSDEEKKERQSLNPSSSHPSQKVCFPKLATFHVSGCSKLKCIFSASMAGDLPLLRSLFIEDCSKLEQVFGSVSEAHDAEAIELVLPKLEWVTLRELPSLIDICAGFQSELQFQALKYCEVKDCPNLSSTTLTALHNKPINPL